MNINKKIGAIIVSTPFQIMSAYSIIESKCCKEYDLYIIGNFNDYLKIAECIRNTKVFAHVITYNLNEIRVGHKNKTFLKSVLRQFSYLNFAKIGKRIVLSERCYNAVYYAAAVSATELLFYFQRYYKPKFILFDDGIMTYRNVDRVLGNAEKISLIKSFLSKIYGTIKPEILVYLPNLFTSMNPHIPKPNKLRPLSLDARKILCSIFRINSDNRIDEVCVVIEPNVKDYLSEDSIEELEIIYSLLEKKVGVSNIVFKRHPRDKRKHNLNRKYLSSVVPFELFGCIQDLSNKILIAWDSTAMLTPKMFYNQEPKVILLYRIINGKLNNYEVTNNLYELFADMYSDSSKYLIPNSIDELKLIIESL